MTSAPLILLGLFYAFSPLFSEGFSIPLDSTFLEGYGQHSWPSAREQGTCPQPPTGRIKDYTSTCQCPEPPSFNEMTYADLLHGLYVKMHGDVSSFSPIEADSFRKWSLSLRETLANASKDTGRALLHLWAYTIWRVFSWLWFLLRNHFLDSCIVVLLYVLTRLMVLGLRKLFGNLPVYLWSTIGVLTWRIMRSSFKIVKSKSSYVKEKAVEGFLSFKVPQKPPKSSVLLVQYSDGSLAGYASCNLLHTGECALLTAEHVATLPGVKVVSTKTGNKIPISEFNCILSSEKSDIYLGMGPHAWTSLLGCKAANYLTVHQLSKGKFSLYTFDGQWQSANGELVGRDGLFASHLSNTTKGQSGAPLFVGKTIVGIHIGGSKENNYNLMTAIPAVEGLTTPQYAFETTAPQGRLFDDTDAIALGKILQVAHQKLKDYKPLSGKAWADMAEEDEDEFYNSNDYLRETQPPVPSAPEVPVHTMQMCVWRTRNVGMFKRTFLPFSVLPMSQRKRDQSRVGKRLRRSQPPKQGSTCFRNAMRRKRNSKAGCRGDGRKDQHSLNREGGDPTVNHEIQSSFSGKTTAPAEEAKNFRGYFQNLFCWEVCTSPSEVAGFERCGNLPRYYHPKQKGRSPWGEDLCLQHPKLEEETRGFGWPLFGAEAELRSLRLQTARWLARAESSKIPSSAERERVIKKTVEAYASCRTNRPAATKDNVLSWPAFLEDFKQAVFSLELDAGVGVPYIAYGIPSHRGWVEDPALLPVLTRLVFDRLQKMSETSFEQLTAEQLVQQGLCDPIRVFVKGEPHKQSKLDEGRYRLIMSVSLVDQLVARVLFQNQNKREICLWRAIPSKPGFGLSTDGQTSEFLELLADQMSTTPEVVVARWREYLVPTDCSGFDWSVAAWMLEDEMEVRNRLTLENNNLTRRLRACWLKCLSTSVLCLSDGSLYAQRVPGVQKSGSYNTSSSNSRIRVMAAYHCGATWAMAMGDDALESVDTNLEVYKDLGFKVEVSGELEFCSHIFVRPDLALPVNRAKMLYKLIHGYNPGAGSVEVISNYLDACFSVLNELRHDPHFVSLLKMWLVDPVLPQNDLGE
uniref:P1-P2 n=1 Tax=Luffa aphid-borne yellows virus TaxID=1462682 RepID=A0A411NPX6_9VIRU|nr:P1-P2 [Luffa aphid-borne yellows virus]